MPQLNLANVQLHYEVNGRGDPLVLIPGLAAGVWIWAKQIEALSNDFRVITFDPRGIGRSEFSAQPMTIRLLADDIAALCHTLGIERAHILGASFGGFVAQEFCLAYPEITRSLVLCCTSFGGPNHVPPAMETLAAMASMNGFNTEERVRTNLMPAFSADFARDHPTEIDRTVELRMANPVSEETYRAQLAAAVAFNVESRLEAVATPTLVISGDADAIVPAQNARNLASKIPGAQLCLIEGGGHLFFIERPAEFNRIITEFLKQN